MSAEEFLEGAMALPSPERWRLGVRLLESLEVRIPNRQPPKWVPLADRPK